MIDLDINKSPINNYYHVIIHVGSVSIDHGLVAKEDLIEILVDLKTTIDAEMEEIV